MIAAIRLSITGPRPRSLRAHCVQITTNHFCFFRGPCRGGSIGSRGGSCLSLTVPSDFVLLLKQGGNRQRGTTRRRASDRSFRCDSRCRRFIAGRERICSPSICLSTLRERTRRLRQWWRYWSRKLVKILNCFQLCDWTSMTSRRSAFKLASFLAFQPLATRSFIFSFRFLLYTN